VNVEKIIAAIEWLERLFRVTDNRTSQMSDSIAANQARFGNHESDAWFGLPRVEWLEELFSLPDNRPL
jgi:hypothetical protein